MLQLRQIFSFQFKNIITLNSDWAFKCNFTRDTPFRSTCLNIYLNKSQVVLGEGNGTSLHYSCLENPMDGGAWQAAVHGVAKSQTRRVTSLLLFIVLYWRRKWQPSPVFLPGESQGRGSLVGCCLWGHTESDTTEVTQQQQQVALVNLTMSSFTQISLKMCLKQTVKFITLITRYYFQELPKAKISLYKNKMKSFKKEITFLHFVNGFNIIRLINIQVKVHKKMINLTSSERLSTLYKLG